MPQLVGFVDYRTPLHGWDAPSAGLIDYTQDNPLLDTARAILAAEFPRRKFETQLGITVGSVRAFKGGTYWIGRERHLGLSRLQELLAKQRLGNVDGVHLITKVFDPRNHSRNEGVSVRVGIHFSRPNVQDPTPRSTLSISAEGSFGDTHLDTLVRSAWRVFNDLVNAAPTTRGRAHWWYVAPVGGLREEGFIHDSADGPAVGSMLFVPRRVVEALGGAEQVASDLEAIDVLTVQSVANRGAVTLLLGQRPGQLPDERAARLRSRLRAGYAAQT